MSQLEKVSVVVPIYNVEQYIHRCVDSILQQTYSNLEIVLVNDGSPDNCGEIVDQYQKEDIRIKVVHKKNGGLSDARNQGMEQVTGNFTMFVDSDDWLDKDMIKIMVNHSLKYKADVVQSAFYYAYEDKLLLDNRYYQEESAPVQLDNKSLMYELIKNENVKNFAWGKLYKTKYIKDIPFKKGVLFEDVFWAHQVMHRVNSYLIIHEPLLYYCQRSDSIVATYSLRNLDIIKGLKERHQFITKYYKELVGESYKLILKTCLIHYNLLVINRRKDKGGVHRKEIELYIQENYDAFSAAVKNDHELRRQLYLFSLYPYFNIAFIGLIKVLRQMGILAQPESFKQVKL